MERWPGHPLPGDLTELLHAWRAGDGDALASLMEHAYPELRKIARRHVAREAQGHSLSSGAVLHEAYLRVVDTPDVDWQDRRHFFATHGDADVVRAWRLARNWLFRELAPRSS